MASRFTHRQLAQLAKYSPDTPLRVIAHIDLDAFYAQVEVKRLNLPPTEPLAVQQWQNLIAVNYAARAHGVTRHETAADALKRCPQLRLVHVATWRCGDVHWSYRTPAAEAAAPSISAHKACLDPYRAESKKILAVFRAACPRVEKASIDESFLDLSAMVHAELLRRYPVLALPPPYGDPLELLPLPDGRVLEWAGSCVLEKEDGEEGVLDWDDVAMAVAAEIVSGVRERVRTEIGYTCSAGIAGNKMLAKLGSGYKKPNSQTVIRPGATQRFLNTLEFTKIRNLGGKLGSQISAAFNTSSLSALLELPLPQLHTKLPAEDATWLYNTIRGIDRSEVNPRTQLKSMLSAKSFRPSITTSEQALQWLRVFVADIHSRLVDEEGVVEGRRRPTVMTMMHRAGATQKTRQVAMTARIELDAMLALAETLLKGMVAEGGAYPCAGLSLQVGGFEERESGNRGIAGFLVKRVPEEPAAERAAKRRREEGEEGIGRYVRRSEDEEELDRDLEEESLALPQSSPPPPAEAQSPNNGPPPHSPPPPPAAPPPPPPPETYTYTCPHCATAIPLQDQAEHQDWHFAKSLADQDKAAARERIASAKVSPPAPPPPPPAKKGPKKGKKGGGGGLEKGQSRLAFGKS